VRGPKGNTKAKSKKRKPSPLKAGGEVVTPNPTKPEMMVTNGNAEGPPATPIVLKRKQQKEAGTLLMEGMDFNKRRTPRKRSKNTDETDIHKQNIMAQRWKTAKSMTMPEEENVTKSRKEEDY
jgi:hypothetical protein